MRPITIFAWIFSVAMAALVSAPGDATAFTRSDSFMVRNDHGGYVVDYAISMLKLQQSHRPVVFGGRCDSACTMYLGLDRAQTCILPSAKFGFHLPFGSSATGNRGAASFLMKKYPHWVVSWIKANGGLSHQLKVMSYDYARQFVKPCGTSMRLL